MRTVRKKQFQFEILNWNIWIRIPLGFAAFQFVRNQFPTFPQWNRSREAWDCRYTGVSALYFYFHFSHACSGPFSGILQLFEGPCATISIHVKEKSESSFCQHIRKNTLEWNKHIKILEFFYLSKKRPERTKLPKSTTSACIQHHVLNCNLLLKNYLLDQAFSVTSIQSYTRSMYLGITSDVRKVNLGISKHYHVPCEVRLFTLQYCRASEWQFS